MALNLKSAIPKFLGRVNRGLTSIGSQVKDPLTPQQAKVVRNVGTALTIGAVGSVVAPVLANPVVASAIGRGAVAVGKTAIKNPKTTLVLGGASSLGAGILFNSPKARSYVGENIGGVVKSPYLAGRNIAGFIEGTDTISKGTGAKVGGVLGGVLGAVAGAGAVYGYDKIFKDDEQLLIDTPVTAEGNGQPPDAVIGDDSITDNSPQAMVTEKSRGVSKKRKKKVKPSAQPIIKLNNNNYINIKNSLRAWN